MADLRSAATLVSQTPDLTPTLSKLRHMLALTTFGDTNRYLVISRWARCCRIRRCRSPASQPRRTGSAGEPNLAPPAVQRAAYRCWACSIVPCLGGHHCLTRIGERAKPGHLTTVSDVVSDHGRSGAGWGDANRWPASCRRLGVVEHGGGTIPLVLLHGWPQTSHAWRHVTPLLASDCHTLAYDLPGIGSSEPVVDRFDKWSISGDLHASLDQRGIQRPLVVGHGMGAQVAYAYLRRYPAQVRGVMVLDTPIAGIGGCEDLFTSSAFWHIGFHQTMCGDTGLAELLVAGRERRYIRSHIDRFAAHPDAISDADVAIYAQGYQGPQRLTAGFALYRTIPLDIACNERHTATVDPPIQLAFAEYCHATVLPEVAAGLGEAGARYVATSIIADSGHWVAEEQPAKVAAAINRFIASI